MSQRLPRRALLALALALAAFLSAPAVAGAFELRVSSSPTRVPSQPLEGAALSGNAYVFLTEDPAAEDVSFWLDDPSRSGPPRRVEGNPPWDFSGTNADDTARPFDTASVANGLHVITAEATLPGGGSQVLSATFTIANGSGSAAPDQVHLAWVGDPSTTLTIVWHTQSASTPSTLEYRQAGATTWIPRTGALRPSGAAGKLHEATLTGLVPGTAYEYGLIGDGGVVSQVYTGRTAPAPSGHPAFDTIFFADTGVAGRPDGLTTGTTQVVNEITALDPLLVLLGGDYTYSDSDPRFATLDSAIDTWFNQEQSIFSRSTVMPSYGSHEVVWEEGYDEWSARFPTPAGFDGRRYYSFDVGDTHFISLLAVTNPGGLPQAAYDWLVADIQAAKNAGKRWIIPYMHVPAFSDGSSHGSNLQLRSQLGPLFEQQGIKLVLTAHDQNYERTFPLTNVPATNTPTSTDLSCYDSQFLTTPPPSYTAARNNTHHHFTRLRVMSDRLRVETYGVVGDGTTPVIQDSFEYRVDGCLPGYPRPAGAVRVRVPLVIAYAQCSPGSAHHTHGGGIAQPSCNPAVQASSRATIGTQGSTGQPTTSVGSVSYTVLPGDTGTGTDEADVALEAGISDVRRKDNLADYAGELRVNTTLRITDRLNGASADEGATVVNIPFGFTVPCAPTAEDATVGSTCSIDTTADAITAGTITEGKRAIWELGQVQVFDGGPDGDGDTADNTLFATQGVFVP